MISNILLRKSSSSEIVALHIKFDPNFILRRLWHAPSRYHYLSLVEVPLVWVGME